MKNILTQCEKIMMKIFKKRHRDWHLFKSSKAFSCIKFWNYKNIFQVVDYSVILMR